MVYEHLKAFATLKNWKFNAGAEHWQNILDEEDDTSENFEDKKIALLLLYEDEDDKLNEYAGLDKTVITGSLMLLVRSKLTDKDFNFHKENYINPMKRIIAPLVRDSFDDCEGLRLSFWKKIELHNVFDTNMSGIKIDFKTDVV